MDSNYMNFFSFVIRKGIDNNDTLYLAANVHTNKHLQVTKYSHGK